MTVCPQCGAEMRLDIATQQLLCSHCDYSRAVEDGDSKVIVAEERLQKEENLEVTVFTCPQCGSEIMSTDNTAATFCNFCGSSTVLSSRIATAKRPNFIIPFKKTKQDCQEAFKKRLSGALFLSSDFKKKGSAEGFRGIYMPYWIYNISLDGKYKINKTEETRNGDYVTTKIYRRKGKVTVNYEGIYHDGATDFYDSLSELLSPYNLNEALSFDPKYFSGFYADIPDVPVNLYEEDALATAHRLTLKQLEDQEFSNGYNVEDDSIDKELYKLNGTEIAMFPVWFMTYRSGDRIVYTAINGQTGKVIADLPISVGKFLTSSLLCAVPTYVLLELFFTVTPQTLHTWIPYCAILTLWAQNTQLYFIEERENHSNDKGLNYLKGPLPSSPKAPAPNSTRLERLENWLDSHDGDALLWSMLLVGLAFTADLFTEEGFRWFELSSLLVGFYFTCKLSLASFNKERRLPQGHRRYFPFLLLPICFMYTLGISIVKPAADLMFYSSVIAQLLAIALILLNMIGQHNLLTTMSLPQFNRPGGDDNA